MVSSTCRLFDLVKLSIMMQYFVVQIWTSQNTEILRAEEGRGIFYTLVF
jgi:hypothetical protein